MGRQDHPAAAGHRLTSDLMVTRWPDTTMVGVSLRGAGWVNLSLRETRQLAFDLLELAGPGELDDLDDGWAERWDADHQDDDDGAASL